MTCLECTSPDLRPVDLTEYELLTCARCGATFGEGARELKPLECSEISHDQEWRDYRHGHKQAHFWRPRRLGVGG